MTNIKVLFLGSSSFAIPILKTLVDLGAIPVVITRPDKPAGRGRETRSTPVKEWGLRHNLPVWEPHTLRTGEFFDKASLEKPDLILSAAYGQHVPIEILKLPRLGSINLHPSLLPSYRGAAPVQRALMAGETQTGITLAYMTEKWDSGDILLQRSCPVSEEDDSGKLLEKLAQEGAMLLKEALSLLCQGKLKAFPQDESKATYAPKIKSEETWINWNRSAREILNLIRGLSPEPGARSFLGEIQIKIFGAALLETNGNAPGMIFRLEKEGPVVAAQKEALLLSRVQPESRKILAGKDFINGYRIQIGQFFHS